MCIPDFAGENIIHLCNRLLGKTTAGRLSRVALAILKRPYSRCSLHFLLNARLPVGSSPVKLIASLGNTAEYFRAWSSQIKQARSSLQRCVGSSSAGRHNMTEQAKAALLFWDISGGHSFDRIRHLGVPEWRPVTAPGALPPAEPACMPRSYTQPFDQAAFCV